jgi:peptidoglycan/xylan/chitin deacetylase (PgdA/CDA1 family)
MRRNAGQLVKWAAGLADIVHPAGDGLVILIYHRVGRRTTVSVDLPGDLFDAQLAHLARHYQVLTLDDAAEHLAAGSPPRGKPAVVVTFDDGTGDFVDEAVPRLVTHGVPATLYLATAFVENQLEFADDGRPASWAGLADAVSTGLVTIGSHSHSHALFDRADSTTAASELDRSVELIGERLGVAATHFAYPKALLGSPAAEAEVRARFRTAAVAGTRPNPWRDTDTHRLYRSPVQIIDGMRWFARKAAGGMRFEDILRDRVNRRRYAGSVT